ncbi:fluoride efflux transporter CrcB [Texcoconibacillus texcoconensis]|uniref:Fluoride-specific ion channel FluC n=1 Tax=Texcoconibacillus texcoconensis TaxID=1095777 RepID=A0A840QSG1_9BACI|nr:CrcB protein [Texcoconibacillus texcoconensis]
MSLLSVGLGGALGAICRYLLGEWVKEKVNNPSIPLAMLIVNLLGSLGLGVFFGVVYGMVPMDVYDDPLFLLIGIGFFGAFTTFSTFSVEAVELIRKRTYLRSFFYVMISIIGSVALFVLGIIGFI